MAETPEEVDLRSRVEQIDIERQEAKDELNRERLTRVTNEMIRAMTSPEFVERVRSARSAADRGAGMDTAAELLSVENLRRSGVDIPDDFRMTSRVFEDREQGVRIAMAELPETQDMMPLGWGGCAGAGGLTFCGCGGFST